MAKKVLVVGAFSEARTANGLPEGWTPLTFKNIDRHTEYRLVHDAKTRVIRAVSNTAASGLIRKVTIDPATYPIVAWRWKITSVFENGDVTRKTGDDYPARLYITFAYNPEDAGFLERAQFEAARLLYGEYPPGAALNYIWANRAPVGTIVDNPYTAKAKMVVVESGNSKAGRWRSEQRNIAEDYRRAFGDPPPMISGVAIMTDTDNTGEATVSYFGDISFKTAESP
jgi:hypothetical protein